MTYTLLLLRKSLQKSKQFSRKMTDFLANQTFEDQENQNGEFPVGIQETVCLYSVELQVQTREFKGQVSGLNKCSLAINCNSLDEFKNELWLKINDKLKREIVFDETTPQWHECVSPKEEDMERFVLFYDTKSKRSSILSKINVMILNHWRSKEIWLYIHVYSMSVTNLTLWKKVQKILIEPMNRDRAGASSISEMNTLVVQLKDVHRLQYQSNHINWLMWANRIQASEPHLRENLIRSPPPADMLHLFAVARTAVESTVAEMRQNLCVAENVNEGVSTGLARMRYLVDNVMEIQKTIVQLQNEQQSKIELLNHELKTMETQSSTTRSLLNSMEQAVPPIETNFGRQLFSQIQDQEDVDHI